jgi:hypothetical protein
MKDVFIRLNCPFNLIPIILKFHDLSNRFIPQYGPIVEEGEQRSPTDYNFLYTSA